VRIAALGRPGAGAPAALPGGSGATRAVPKCSASRPHYDGYHLLPGHAVVEAKRVVGIPEDRVVLGGDGHVATGVQRIRRVDLRRILERADISARDRVAHRQHRHLGELLPLERVIGPEGAVGVSADDFPSREGLYTSRVVTFHVGESRGSRGGHCYRQHQRQRDGQSQ